MKKPKTGGAYTPIVSHRLSSLVEDIHRPPDPELASRDSTQLLQNALCCLNELYRRAKAGEDASTDYVFRVATQTTRLLLELAEDPSPTLLSIASCTPQWPFFYSPKPNFLDSFQSVLDRLKIGSACQLNVNPRSRWSSSVQARQWAMKVFLFVHEVKAAAAGKIADGGAATIRWTELTKAAEKLPPLTKSTADLWIENVGWPMILKATDGKPERHQQLRKLGLYRAKHTTTAKPGSKTSESNIRDGIKQAVTQALRGMAAQP